MALYYLDSNAFISPDREGYYSFLLAPTFWQMLEQKANDSILASTRKVCDELIRRRDTVGLWADARKNTSLFVDPNKDVQDAFRRVADYVMNNYRHHRAEEFLGGADPWLIAHALASNGKVVSLEKPNSLTAQEVKIPNVCQAVGINSVTLFEMFYELKISLEFKG